MLQLALISGSAEIRPWKKSNVRTNAMWNGVLRVVPFEIHFLTCYLFDHDKISMSNANIDVLYAGSLSLSFPSIFTFYKWCVTKVAHCICIPSSDNLFKQFGPRSGLTEYPAWSGSKLYDTDGFPYFY